MIPVLVLMFMPYITGDWSSSNMQWDIGANGGLPLVIVWLYFMCWSSYGMEVVATFAPEYHDTEKDTTKALRSAALFGIAVYALLPLGLGGTLGTQAVVDDPTFIAFFIQAFDELVGNALANVLDRLRRRRPRAVDEHGDDGRLQSPVRHREGRDDDQAARDAQPLPRARARDDASTRS